MGTGRKRGRMTDKEIIIDGVNVAECEFLYTDNYNDKCCSASIGGDCLCKPSEMICLNYVENLKKTYPTQRTGMRRAGRKK